MILDISTVAYVSGILIMLIAIKLHKFFVKNICELISMLENIYFDLHYCHRLPYCHCALALIGNTVAHGAVTILTSIISISLNSKYIFHINYKFYITL